MKKNLTSFPGDYVIIQTPGANDSGLTIYSLDTPLMTYCISIYISQQSAVDGNVYIKFIFLPRLQKVIAPNHCVYMKQSTNILTVKLYLFHHK